MVVIKSPSGGQNLDQYSMSMTQLTLALTDMTMLAITYTESTATSTATITAAATLSSANIRKAVAKLRANKSKIMKEVTFLHTNLGVKIK